MTNLGLLYQCNNALSSFDDNADISCNWVDMTLPSKDCCDLPLAKFLKLHRELLDAALTFAVIIGRFSGLNKS